jgi:phosphatidyl-myo-inositol dimannoside synthase
VGRTVGGSTGGKTRVSGDAGRPRIRDGSGPRLLIISTEFPPGPGGIGTHAYHLAEQLQRLGWAVAVVTSQASADDSEMRAFNAAQPFPIAVLRRPDGSPVGPFARLRTISQWLESWRPDVALASGQRSVWRVSSLWRARGRPWVAIGHGTEFGVTRWRDRWLTRRAFERAAAVVSVSQYTQARMLAIGIRPRRALVIPNGADPKQFRALPPERVERTRRELGLDRSRVLLTVGKVTPRKGQDVVIRALPAMLTRMPSLVYLVVGLPAQRSAYERLAADLGVAERVRFLGAVEPDDLVRYVNCADLIVAPSRHTPAGEFEGYGIAVVEAALCGKPAVVSRDCGLEEAILDGRTGVAIAENDPAATASAVLALLEDDDRRRAMGEAARIRALAEQTWEQRATTYDRCLRDLVHQWMLSRHAPASQSADGPRGLGGLTSGGRGRST